MTRFVQGNPGKQAERTMSIREDFPSYRPFQGLLVVQLQKFALRVTDREVAAAYRSIRDRLSRRKAIIKGLHHVLCSLKLLRWRQSSQATPKYMVVSAVGTDIPSAKIQRRKAKYQQSAVSVGWDTARRTENRQTQPGMGSPKFSPEQIRGIFIPRNGISIHKQIKFCKVNSIQCIGFVVTT